MRLGTAMAVTPDHENLHRASLRSRNLCIAGAPEKPKMTTRKFVLPTRPYSVIDAINRYALATGSLCNAARGADADYNGHFVAFAEPNQFKPYWTCYYTWAGIRTIGRGTLAQCCAAAKTEYDRGALGAAASVTVTSDEDAAACLAAGFVEAPEGGESGFLTKLHKEVPNAFWLEQHGLCPGAVGFLANSPTLEEFRAKVDAARIAARR